MGENTNIKTKKGILRDFSGNESAINLLLSVSSNLSGFRGALKREVVFHTFLCVLA